MATEEKSYSSLDTEEIFKSYGILMRDAVSLNCDGLIKCFDDILLSFDTYDLHLEQVYAFIRLYVIKFHTFLF